MPRVFYPVLLVLLLSTNVVGREKEASMPQFTIGKDTTHITEPLADDGYPDYAGAINQLLGRGVTAENNANVFFWLAHGPHPEGATMPAEFFKLMGMESPPEEGDYFLNLGAYVKERVKIDPVGEAAFAIYDQQSEVMKQPWTADQYPHLAGWLKANEKPLALVVEGTKRETYFSPVVVAPGETLISVLLPAVQASREFARALAARAMLNLGAGRHGDAWQDLLACHRLGRLVGRGPTLIEGLVGIAIDGIATGADLTLIEGVQPTADQARGYLHDFDSLPPVPDMVAKIDLSERYMCLDATMLLVRGQWKEFSDTMLGGHGEMERLMSEAKLIDWDATMRLANRRYDQLVSILREADRRKRGTRLDALQKELEKVTGEKLTRQLAKSKDPPATVGTAVGHILMALFLPAVGAVKEAEDRAAQQHRNLRIAFALAAYHADHRSYPRTLGKLSPKYLAEVPGDLFSGKPLVYRPTDRGYLLYSIGPNGEDDEGRWYDDETPGDDPNVHMPRNANATVGSN